jgi:hypothetical protein
LLGANCGVVDGQHVHLRRVLDAVLVDADDGLLTGVDASLFLGGALLDHQLGHPAVNGGSHATYGGCTRVKWAPVATVGVRRGN